MKQVFQKKNAYIIGAIFVASVFAFITYKTPLAGDDWGYALNGMQGNPIQMAISFYFSWSGRFFSELWGFVVAPNKWLWNILNPLLFLAIFLGMYKLCRVRRTPILSVLLVLAIMLSVDDNVRMETYTWIMGTTYVVPLCFSILYFVVVDEMFKKDVLGKKEVILSCLSNILLFVIGLMMENIAAAMVGGITVLIIYAYFFKRKIIKYLIINLFFSSLSFLIMRLSPGSSFRLMRDSAEFAEMGIVEKLVTGFPSFLEMTFINNNYMILFFSLIMILMLLFTKEKIPLLIKVLLIGVFGLAIFTVFSFVPFGVENIMMEPKSIYSTIFWPIFTVSSFVAIYLSYKPGYYRDKTLFLLVIAGACGVVMLMSPIYGSRSAIYTIYYIIIVSVLVLDSFEMKKLLQLGLLAMFLFVIYDRTNEYIFKYRLVGLAQQERLEIIKYYQEHPEDEEVWIPKFPIFTVHGADIEPGDTYHFEVFKDYYQLPQAADKIIFYIKDSD